MEGQEFEFVTITNPDEIRDPKAQNAIRRKARHRIKEGKSLRQPFKFVFDLPIGDAIATGTELQVWRSEDSVFAEQGRLENHTGKLTRRTAPYGNTLVGPISPLILLPGLNAQIVSIAHTADNDNLCPLLQSLWDAGQRVLTEFFVEVANKLANVSVHIIREASVNTMEQPAGCQLYTKAIACLKARLGIVTNDLNQYDLMVVLLLAYYDILLQDSSRWRIHMTGLTGMIRDRAEFETLPTSESILKLNSWIDISGCFLFDHSPFSHFPPNLLLESPQRASLGPILHRWNTAFPELSDITDLWSQAIQVLQIIENRATSEAIWKDTEFVEKFFNMIVHQLLSLPRYADVIENSNPSPQLIMREAMRRAYLILIALLREKFSLHPNGILQHRNKVKELLIRYLGHWEGFLELRLWVLLISSLAAGNDEDAWHITEIRDTMIMLGIGSWEEVIGILRGLLWMGETFRARIEKLKGVFEEAVI